MATSPREFVVFFEYNIKENETFIYYLQWTGNEDAIILLEKATEKANYGTLSGSHILYSLETFLKLPEYVVDIHCRVVNPNNSYHKMFSKCTGVFKPSIRQKDIDTMDDYQLGEFLDECYYGCQIQKEFSDYRNYYADLLAGKITEEEYKSFKKV